MVFNNKKTKITKIIIKSIKGINLSGTGQNKVQCQVLPHLL